MRQPPILIAQFRLYHNDRGFFIEIHDTNGTYWTKTVDTWEEAIKLIEERMKREQN